LPVSDEGKSTQRLPGLDGLRAVAVSMVIAYHVMASEMDTRVARYAPPGIVGVRIFFVISGFLITWLLLCEEKKNGSISLEKFYIRRVFRILPPAFFYLGVISLLGFIGVLRIHVREIVAAALFVRNIFTDLPHAHGAYSDWTGHYWSLSCEEQFYLLWPMLLILSRGRKRMITACLVVAVPILTQELQFRVGHSVLLSVPAYFSWLDSIQVGCLLALLREDPATRPFLRGPILQHPLTPLIAVIVACLTEYFPTATILKPSVEAVCFALIINYLIEDHRRLPDRLLALWPVEYIGKLSYSLYLWQQIFCWADPTLPAKRFQIYPFSLLFTLICGVFSYYLVEQPMLRLRARLFDRNRPESKPVIAKLEELAKPA
jgi:peptidoglycan/LPS O-acetylase OafA/YrhL